MIISLFFSIKKDTLLTLFMTSILVIGIQASYCLPFCFDFNLLEVPFPATLCPFLSPNQNSTTCLDFKIPIHYQTHNLIQLHVHFALLLAFPYLQPLYGSLITLLCHAHEYMLFEYPLIEGSFLLLSNYNIVSFVIAFKCFLLISSSIFEYKNT